MGVGLQHPLNRESLNRRGFEDSVGRFGCSLAAPMVVVEHGVDHGRTLGLGVSHEIADRVGRLVEEGANDRL